MEREQPPKTEPIRTKIKRLIGRTIRPVVAAAVITTGAAGVAEQASAAESKPIEADRTDLSIEQAQEVPTAFPLPDAELTDSEKSSIDLGSERPTVNVESNSELDQLIGNLQPRLESIQQEFGEGAASIQVSIAGPEHAQAEGSAMALLKIEKEGISIDGNELKQGTILFQTREENGEPTWGYLEPVTAEGYGETTPVLVPVSQEIVDYLSQFNVELPAVGEWMAMTAVERDGLLIPVSIAGQVNGEPVGIIISFGGSEAPATPVPGVAGVEATSGIESEAERKWDDINIQSARPESRGEMQPGIRVERGVEQITVSIVGRFEDVYQGGHFEGDEDVWYVDLEAGSNTFTVMLGRDNWFVFASDIPLRAADGMPTLQVTEQARRLSAQQLAEYIKQNPGIPVMLDYWGGFEENMEAIRNLTGEFEALSKDVMGYYDQLDMPDLLKDLRTAAGGYYSGAVTPGQIIMLDKIWIPGFHGYVDSTQQ